MLGYQGDRPQVASELIREYVYLYGIVSPKDATSVYLIMPTPGAECFQIFLTLAKKSPRQFILLFVGGAGNHHSNDLEVPDDSCCIISHLIILPT